MQIVKACNTRDTAIVLFMADSGLRRKETIYLNWGDVGMQTGLVRVKKGKGKKDRSDYQAGTTGLQADAESFFIPNQTRNALCKRWLYTSFQQDKKADRDPRFPSCVAKDIYDPVTTRRDGCLALAEPGRLGVA